MVLEGSIRHDVPRSINETLSPPRPLSTRDASIDQQVLVHQPRTNPLKPSRGSLRGPQPVVSSPPPSQTYVVGGHVEAGVPNVLNRLRVCYIFPVASASIGIHRHPSTQTHGAKNGAPGQGRRGVSPDLPGASHPSPQQALPLKFSAGRIVRGTSLCVLKRQRCA